MPSPLEREPATPGDFRPTVRAVLSAIAAVTSVYVYFLIFAQFGFLQGLLEATGRSGTRLRPVLLAMGGSGIAASALMARCYRAERARTWLAGSLVTAGIAAALTLLGDSMGIFLAAAALMGAGLGGATVALAATMIRVTGARRLGLVLGAGTGLAYAICNLPAVFQASATAQAGIALGAVSLGLFAVAGFELRAPAVKPAGNDYAIRGMVLWIAALMALVWLDSAAFYVIQHNPDLHDALWAGSGRLWTNAGLHLAAALGAGWLLDRGRSGTVIVIAGGLLALACGLLHGRGAAPGVVVALYATGVSLYSTALIYYPGRSGRAGVAAAVYAVAGWTGSALGIGLVEHAQRVPGWFPLAASLTVMTAMALRQNMAKN